MNGPLEFWHVQMPDGSVSTMTLDELDAAFQADTITEQTYVLKQGESTWQTLAALLGLDEPASPTPAPVVATYSSPPASAEVAPLYSLRPVVSEVSPLDDDLDFGGPAFRPSKKRPVIIAGSIAALVAVGVLIATVGSSSGGTPAVAAASQPPPPQPVAVTPPPPPVAETTPAATDRFNDAQKKALQDADKAHAAQQKAKMSTAPPRRSSGYKSDSKPVFHKGGSKYDPLNSSL